MVINEEDKQLLNGSPAPEHGRVVITVESEDVT